MGEVKSGCGCYPRHMRRSIPFALVLAFISALALARRAEKRWLVGRVPAICTKRRRRSRKVTAAHRLEFSKSAAAPVSSRHRASAICKFNPVPSASGPAQLRLYDHLARGNRPERQGREHAQCLDPSARAAGGLSERSETPRRLVHLHPRLPSGREGHVRLPRRCKILCKAVRCWPPCRSRLWRGSNVVCRVSERYRRNSLQAHEFGAQAGELQSSRLHLLRDTTPW